VPEVGTALAAIVSERGVETLNAAQAAKMVSEAVDRVRSARPRRQAQTVEERVGDDSARHAGTAAGEAGDGGRRPGQEASILVLRELTAVRLGIARALALTERHSSEFVEEHGTRVAGLVRAAIGSLGTMLDLIISGNESMSEAAIRALLDEGEP